MGLGTWLVGLSEDQKRAKAKAWDDLVQKNPRIATTAEEYNTGLANFMKTGALPTSRKQEVRVNAPTGVEEIPGPGGVPIRMLPETSVEQRDVPIRMGRPGYAYNQDTGAMEALQDDVNLGGGNVFRYNPANPRPETPVPGGIRLQQIKVPDPITGELRTVTVAMQDGVKGFRIVNPPRPRAARPGGDDPTGQKRWALDAMRAYRSAKKARYDGKTGEWVPGYVDDDTMNEALDAASILGIPVQQVQELDTVVNDPGFDGWLSRMLPGGETGTTVEPGATVTRIGTGGKGAPKPGGKTLTADQAREYLKKANGNKDEARRLAKAEGFSF